MLYIETNDMVKELEAIKASVEKYSEFLFPKKKTNDERIKDILTCDSREFLDLIKLITDLGGGWSCLYLYSYSALFGSGMKFLAGLLLERMVTIW